MPHQAREAASSQSPWWNKQTVHWQANQVILTFHSSFGYRPSMKSREGVAPVIGSLNLAAVAQFLAPSGFILTSFTSRDIPQPPQVAQSTLDELEQLEDELERLEAEVEQLERVAQRNTSLTLLRANDGQSYKTLAERDLEELDARIEELEREIEQRERIVRQRGDGDNGNSGNASQLPIHALSSPVGKYLFTAPSGQGTVAICFFHCTNPTLAPTSSMHSSGKDGPTSADSTQAVVRLINQNLDKLRQNGNVPIVAAMPNWISGGVPTSGFGSGCPATVPIPVSADQAYASWRYTLPELSSTLQGLQGDNVSVFVLDTIPTVEHIKDAALKIADKNLLLQSVATAIDDASLQIEYQKLPKRLGSHLQTGKDIFKRVVGFKMPDHGLFVTGIIHDLIPGAKITCKRVLNDYAVGDLGTIFDALSDIQERMVTEQLEQVVINMSLVFLPPEHLLPGVWFGNEGSYRSEDLASMIHELELLRVGFHLVIQTLVAQGAVVVASAGNDSDSGGSGAMAGRFGPRHPAAFSEVISVGAVDAKGAATSYSDYPALLPQHNGVATYGGSLPVPAPPATAIEPKPTGAVTWAVVTDAAIGLYISHDYPMLSATDEPPNEYPSPAYSNGWAYWSGTSFATPIISAVAAKVLQARKNGKLPTTLSVQDMITTGTGQQLLTGGAIFPHSTGFGADVGVLKAEQKYS